MQSMCDDVLHAVSIPMYETHRWKEDSCSPNVDRDLVQNLTARPQPYIPMFFCSRFVALLGGKCSGICFTARENHGKP